MCNILNFINQFQSHQTILISLAEVLQSLKSLDIHKHGLVYAQRSIIILIDPTWAQIWVEDNPFVDTQNYFWIIKYIWSSKLAMCHLRTSTVVPQLSGPWLSKQFQVKYHNQNICINIVVFNGLQKFCK